MVTMISRWSAANTSRLRDRQFGASQSSSPTHRMNVPRAIRIAAMKLLRRPTFSGWRW
jgi:hypothetical protein